MPDRQGVQPRFNPLWERVFTQFPKTRSSVGAKSSVNGENPMKILIPTFAVALALAFTAPAFAGDVTTAKTEADCQKAGGMWDSKMNMCMEKKQY